MSIFDLISGAGGFSGSLPGAASGAAGAAGFSLAGSALTGVGAIGLGLQAFGTFEQMQGAEKIASASHSIADLEQQENYVRQKAMQVQTRRNQMEVLRNQQRSRSLALASATGQGAQLGSGLQGGYGQVAGQAGNNLLGIAQNYEAGQQMFSLTSSIDQWKMQEAQAQTQMSTGAGLSSLGSSAMGSINPLSKLIGYG